MKKKNIAFPLVLSALSVFTIAGCGNHVEVGGESTIQIRCYKGGYGTEWLHVMADEFSELFPEVSFDFVEESSLVTENATQEIMVPSENQIDLYFTNGSDMYNLIDSSKQKLRSSEKTLLEPLNDVYESKGIGADGKEEAETIASRMFDGYAQSSMYNGSIEKWRGNMYKLPWADAITGVFCNPAVLAKYNLEIPLTSNEFVSVVEAIASHSKEDKIYPFTFGGNNARGYWLYLWETWFAQYSGKETFDRWVMCDPGDGDIENNGWKVYEDIGILKSLEAMYGICDLSYNPNGAVSKKHTEAQNELIRGTAAFMVDGER